ncbi:Spy/CpxP family protein refolding chaperone [Variovorax sp. RHLX14]|uniref:Spy/CpxP family protein refolding chaperone n=1 Tax=Variovorax sp. RHLX14 TaxID=1259731 RepID=UPI003F446551
MISSRQRILWAGLLASATFAAAAQTPPPASVPTNSPAAIAAAAQHRAGNDPADKMTRPHDGKGMERMQERRARHLNDLKAKLKLDASQQGAWSTFMTSIQPPPMAQRPDRAAMRAEFEKLTTPQRLDRMQARQAERAAMASRRADATRAFYATLKPEQQKTFDAESMRFEPRGEHGPRGHGEHGPAPKG